MIIAFRCSFSVVYGFAADSAVAPFPACGPTIEKRIVVCWLGPFLARNVFLASFVFTYTRRSSRLYFEGPHVIIFKSLRVRALFHSFFDGPPSRGLASIIEQYPIQHFKFSSSLHFSLSWV
jgi:hypothetical protein